MAHRRPERQRQDDAGAPSQRPAATDRGPGSRSMASTPHRVTVAAAGPHRRARLPGPGSPDLRRVGSSRGRVRAAQPGPARSGAASRGRQRPRAVGLEAEAQTNPYDLGASRRKLLALASVLAMRTPVVVLDEPTTGQDERGVQRVGSVIEQVARRRAHGHRHQPRHALRRRALRAGRSSCAPERIILDGAAGRRSSRRDAWTPRLDVPRAAAGRGHRGTRSASVRRPPTAAGRRPRRSRSSPAAAGSDGAAA